MVTIYQRCVALGFPDCVTCSIVGHWVSDGFVNNNLHGRITTQSIEPHGTFEVWAYPDDYAPIIDTVIHKVNLRINARILRPDRVPPFDIPGKKKRKRINE